jgi:hypothetical protein
MSPWLSRKESGKRRRRRKVKNKKAALPAAFPQYVFERKGSCFVTPRLGRFETGLKGL